jgi:hypothetical protein
MRRLHLGMLTALPLNGLPKPGVITDMNDELLLHGYYEMNDSSKVVIDEVFGHGAWRDASANSCNQRIRQ